MAFLADVFFSIVLISGIYAAADRKRTFVTLTTTGYGDITPVSNPARSLAILEAALGQLYLAVTIARLVGIHISQCQQERDE
jgi:hypothetical protein